jgi:hypothetical protein
VRLPFPIPPRPRFPIGATAPLRFPASRRQTVSARGRLPVRLAPGIERVTRCPPLEHDPRPSYWLTGAPTVNPLIWSSQLLYPPKVKYS